MHEQNTDWVADVKKSTLLLSSPVSLLPRLMFFLPLVASSWLTVCFCLSSRFVSTSLLITLSHVCPRRSLPPQAPTTPTQGSHRVTWRPSTKWATWASTSPKSGTRTTLSPQKSPWRTRWSHTTHDYGHLGPNNLFYWLFSIQNICFIACPLSLYSAGQGLEAQSGHFLCAQHWVRTVQTSTFTTLLWKEPDSH